MLLYQIEQDDNTKPHCPIDQVNFDDPGRAPPTSAGVIAYLPGPFSYLFLCDANIEGR